MDSSFFSCWGAGGWIEIRTDGAEKAWESGRKPTNRCWMFFANSLGLTCFLTKWSLLGCWSLLWCVPVRRWPFQYLGVGILGWDGVGSQASHVLTIFTTFRLYCQWSSRSCWCTNPNQVCCLFTNRVSFGRNGWKWCHMVPPVRPF